VAMPVGFAKVPYGPSWEGVGVIPEPEHMVPAEKAYDHAVELIQKKTKQKG
jgi:hypothetical protein